MDGRGSSPPVKLPIPLLFKLYANPREDEEKTATDSWIIGPVLKMVAEFEESAKRYPLIAMDARSVHTRPR